MADAKKLFIKTYGCQMNVYDSERMAETLWAQGYVHTDTADDADMILLNTCHIREKAAEKIYSELGKFKALKAANPNLKIGVAGCVAQAEGAEIIRRQPLVDLVVGPQSYHKLPEMEARVQSGKRALDTDFPEEDKFDHLAKRPKAKRGPTAFLTVQEGCDKFCAFCVVPYTRGAEVSRPADRVFSEAVDLVERGVREITLLGQNVNAYHGHPGGLAGLIWQLSEILDLERIRFTTSHPNDMDDALIEAHGTCDKLMPYLHLPVQSGSDRILKAMNRKHTRDSYFNLVDRIRKARPDLLLSGDFIVGFPGETDELFLETYHFLNELDISYLHVFTYSERDYTPAASMEGVVPLNVRKKRSKMLRGLSVKKRRSFYESQLNTSHTVLFEGENKKGYILGFTENYVKIKQPWNPGLILSLIHI